MTSSSLSHEMPQPAGDPIIFEEYFDMGEDEAISPFLTVESRLWAANLTLKAAFLATFLLILSFILSYSTTTQPLSNVLLASVYFLVGIPALIEAVEELIAFEINIDILMTLAAFSSILIGSGMEGGLLLVLFALSGSMEDLVTTKAKSSISSLHRISPTKACTITSDGHLLERSLKDIQVGTSILIKAGQIVPLDGLVIDGVSSVNLVHLTGEGAPVLKKLGDTVPAGARNMDGTLTLRVSHTSADSTLSRIIQLVTQAQEERPVLQRWFDKLSKGYAIAIISLSALFALTLPFIFHIPFLGVEGSVYRSLAFLIAASPCALIIAIPIAYLSAIGACARQGILLKGGITLDALANCSILAFDKTGTLTTGDLSFEGIERIEVGIKNPLSGADKNAALSIAYALEKNAVHPIAKAITNYGKQQKLPSVVLKDFQSIPGYGLSAIVLTEKGEKSTYIGRTEHIISKLTVEQREALQSAMVDPQKKGELCAVLSIDESLFLLRFLDTIRPHIAATIKELTHKNIELVMLTGDHENSAKQIAKELGIPKYFAQLRPEDKMDYVSHASITKGLAMIGDGINDAPALARATVGICMGKVGSTAAIDAADVILLHDNIERVGWLLDKAHQTKRIVKQNLILATAAIFIASIPALSGIIPLWLAVVMHEGGTVLVGLNGLRLLRT